MRDAAWDETLADVRELPATVYLLGQPGPQNVAVAVTLSDGSTVRGTAVFEVTLNDAAAVRARAASAIRASVERP